MNWNMLHKGNDYPSFPEPHSIGPSGTYIAAVVVSMTASLVFKLLRRKHPMYIVGEWVAPFLIMGLYEKMTRPKIEVEYKREVS